MPDLTLSYAGGEVVPPLDPTPDDRGLTNEITVQRINGGEHSGSVDEGPLSTQAPPDGVGVYDRQLEISVDSDGRLANVAGWALHVGTWDEDRYPRISTDIRQLSTRSAQLVADALALGLGGRIVIEDLPEWLPPEAIDQLAMGCSESISVDRWAQAWHTAPAGPYRVSGAAGVVEDFEDDDLAVTITDGGDLPWSRTQTAAHGGLWSAGSPPGLADEESADAIVTVPAGATRLTFFYKVSSEEGFDYFRVFVDSTQALEASGEVDWTAHGLDVSGATTVTFRYVKDATISSGDDVAWIDDLAFTGPGITSDFDIIGSDVTTLRTPTFDSGANTSFDVDVAEGYRWDDGDGPFDVLVDGARLTVTSIVDLSATVQRFSVNQTPVNGVEKRLTAGARVDVFHKSYIGL